MADFDERLFERHASFKEETLAHRRFKQADIQPLIERFSKVQGVQTTVLGQSFEGRPITMLTLGTGKTKVLLWSQMHGDEATATMALFDIFNFFADDASDFTAEKTEILKNCTLYFVPMLNPDGAQRFQRRTAQDIDMNRDALRFQTPEGLILKKLQADIRPDFAFNLHDQNVRYSVGNTAKQTTIAFLATAFDQERNWNPVRVRSMQVICQMYQSLSKYIPGQLAKFSDEFEPRAFGDNIQKWGSSLILIESGGYKNDTEKQFIRKLNFVAILDALWSIAQQSYTQNQLSDYQNIPENQKNLFNLLIKNARFVKNGVSYIKDLGINTDEVNNADATAFSLKSTIEDMGDLSTFYGLEEVEADGLELVKFEKYPNLQASFLISEAKAKADISLDTEPNFILVSASGPAYAVVNGVLHKL